MEQKALVDKYLDNPARLKNLALYSEYAEDALKSSGEWLLMEAKFQDWMKQKPSIVWIAGGPGTGKSYLSAIAISKLNDTYPQDSAHPNRFSVGYFYVKEHDQDLQDLTKLLKTIAYQIASVDSVFQAHVINVLSKPEIIVSPRKIWENLFLNFYCGSRSIPNSAMIIIDGLDEAPRKTIKELFRLIEDLHDFLQNQPRLSFALFGRPELTEHIEPKLHQMLSIIEIGEKNLVDIGLYIKEHVKDVLVVRQLLRSKTIMAARRLARDIRDKVMAKADGMFFKVVLIMNQLYDKERTAYVFQAIDDAPPQLETMIGHVFERLLSNEDVNKDDLKEILTWVSFSKRPLTIAELYAILKTHTGQAYDALEARLRGRFASLFKLNRNHFYFDTDKNDGKPDEENTRGDDSLDIDLFSDEVDLEEDTSNEGDATTQFRGDGNNLVQQDTLNQATVTMFNSIEVRFTHASVRDFLVKDGSKTLAPLLDSSIGIDPLTGDMHLASMCMQSILDYNFEKADCDILSYASEHGRRRRGYERLVVVLTAREHVQADVFGLAGNGHHGLDPLVLGRGATSRGIGRDIADGGDPNCMATPAVPDRRSGASSNDWISCLCNYLPAADIPSAGTGPSGTGPSGTTLDTVKLMLEDPNTLIGLGDGGAHVSIICDASTMTHTLTHWARDRTRGARLPLEWVVRRLTRDNAAVIGLDRAFAQFFPEPRLNGEHDLLPQAGRAKSPSIFKNVRSPVAGPRDSSGHFYVTLTCRLRPRAKLEKLT